jgi:uncharacterized protein YfaT (DUF1175 family)
MSRSIMNLFTGSALVVCFVAVSFLSYLSGASDRPSPSPHPPISRSGGTRTTRPERELNTDADQDGLPDVVELRTFNDRENFRRWFTWIAEMQFYGISEQWNVEQRDCAGLVRFAWREALRRHDRAWYQRMGMEHEPVAADVSYELDSPPLGGKLFRRSPGNYQPNDVLEGKFSEFADAQTLKTFNTNFVGRDQEQVKPGDLLIFHQPWVQKYPYHLMIFLGTPQVSAESGHDWVVYHTGGSANDPGTVKKVRLRTLDKHPDKRWRPVQSNPNFLGFYRLKILDQQVGLE